MKKIEMSEVYGAQDLKALNGCTINTVSGANGDESEGLYFDCKDEAGNLVSFLIMEDGSWHFHDSKKKSITVEQFGELAMLTGCSDIDSVHFNSVDPLIEIVIKPIGTKAADRVLTILRGIFPKLEVRGNEWDFEGELHPLYCCGDPGYNFIISVAVMPENVIKGIGGN